MQTARHPDRESERIRFLRQLNVLDTPIEQRFERLTRVVCRTLKVPISAVSLVDETRQWFKSAQGLDTSQTSREVAFCAHAILDDAPLIVMDALEDDRFRENPLVIGDPNIRSYAGIPLTFAGGLRVGTLCAIDSKPRTFTASDLATLEDLAELVKTELLASKLSEEHVQLIQELNQAERAAMIDSLTQLWNRRGGELLINREWESARRKQRAVSVMVIDIDHFKEINDRFGHDSGDAVLKDLARFFVQHLRPLDAVIRWGGEEFLAVLPEVTQPQIEQVTDRIFEGLCQQDFGVGGINISCGIATGIPETMQSAEHAIKAADERLYTAKRQGRNQFVVGGLEPCTSAGLA